MADAADGEDEFEALDQRLLESQTFSQYKDIEGFFLFTCCHVYFKMKNRRAPEFSAFFGY